MLLACFPVGIVSAAPAEEYNGGQHGDGRGICAAGVDLSEWQGDQVDFKKIREQGFSFVILRAGFSVYMDACFERNYAAAKEAGLNVGVYLYSYAENADDALNEAAALREWLKGKTLEYPVYYDIEEPDIHSTMTPRQITEIALSFLDSMSEAGWLSGLYSCKSWLNHKIETETVCADYECWMAMYLPDGSCDTYEKYDEYCGMWQYSSTGIVEGVPGNTDLNVAFKDYPTICAEYGLNGYLRAEADITESIQMPEVCVPGTELFLNGSLTSDSGDLKEVELCLWDRNGNLAMENHISPQTESFDLSLLTLDTSHLTEGTYICRLTMATDSGKSVVHQGEVVLSSVGIKTEALETPEDLLVGEHWETKGTLTAVSPIIEVSCSILSEEGNRVYTATSYPKRTEFQLRDLASRLKFEKLEQGNYRYEISAVTRWGSQILTDEPFSVWVEHDPVTLEGCTLQEEYHPGDRRLLDGRILSENSAFLDVGVIIRKLSEEEPLAEAHTSGSRTLLLRELADDLQMDLLPCGRYLCTITAVNAAGPSVVLEKIFSVLPDDLSVCGFEPPLVLKAGDSFILSGVIASDYSPLKLVSVTVKDGDNQTVLDAASSPRGPIFDLSDLADKPIFSTLPPGKYRLSIRGENEHVSELLYDSEFTVTSAEDPVRWEGEHVRPDGISYPTGDAVKMTGTLISKYSFIESVTAEIYGDTGVLVSGGKISPMDYSADISELNSQLHLAPLSSGAYRLVISAENEDGNFIMVNDNFSISECSHSSGSIEKKYEPQCDSLGVVCDSRCELCGEKIRSGFVLEKEEHFFEGGKCKFCGQKEPPVYEFQKTDSVRRDGCYLIACREGNDWYALANDGQTCYIAPPDDRACITAPANLAWFLHYKNGEISLFTPGGEKLHLDSNCVSVARGNSNGKLCFEQNRDLFCIMKHEECKWGITFLDGEFGVGNAPTELSVFELRMSES